MLTWDFGLKDGLFNILYPAKAGRVWGRKSAYRTPLLWHIVLPNQSLKEPLSVSSLLRSDCAGEEFSCFQVQKSSMIGLAWITGMLAGPHGCGYAQARQQARDLYRMRTGGVKGTCGRLPSHRHMFFAHLMEPPHEPSSLRQIFCMGRPSRTNYARQ